MDNAKCKALKAELAAQPEPQICLAILRRQRRAFPARVLRQRKVPKTTVIKQCEPVRKEYSIY